MDIDIKYEQANCFDFVFVVIGSINKLAILPDENWNQVKSNIDKVLNAIHMNLEQKKLESCELCTRDIKVKASCNFCHKISCLECYIDSFRKGCGVVKCGFCSQTFGVKCPKKYIDMMIGDIRENAITHRA